MDTNQIYDLLNVVSKEVIGETAIQAVDATSLVALGKQVLNSNYVDPWLNTLIMRIGKTIVWNRSYQSQYKDLALDNIQWGALVQKLDVSVGDFVEDVAWDLEDGDSVDMYIVKKPKAKQKFFAIRSPYSNFITNQQWKLKEAFASAGAMAAFMSAIATKMQTKLTLAHDNQCRVAMGNFMLLTGDHQKIHLVTEYNARTGESVTSDTALFDEAFLRYASARISLLRKKLRGLSVMYNKDNEERFTPDNLQEFYVLDEFNTAMESQMLYGAYHDSYVKMKSGIEVPYWQAAQDPFKLSLTIDDGTGEGTETETLDNIVGVVFDKWALGTFREEEEVLTTPVNARGRYYNTFWHQNQLWFNDLSENGLVFLLD